MTLNTGFTLLLAGDPVEYHQELLSDDRFHSPLSEQLDNSSKNRKTNSEFSFKHFVCYCPTEWGGTEQNLWSQTWSPFCLMTAFSFLEEVCWLCVSETQYTIGEFWVITSLCHTFSLRVWRKHFTYFFFWCILIEQLEDTVCITSAVCHMICSPFLGKSQGQCGKNRLTQRKLNFPRSFQSLHSSGPCKFLNCPIKFYCMNTVFETDKMSSIRLRKDGHWKVHRPNLVTLFTDRKSVV